VTSATAGTSEYGEADPAFFLVTGPLVEAINTYLQRDLQFRSELRYEYLSREANRSWKWLSGGQGYVYVADELAEAMARDSRLHVFAAAGYFDLATPYLAQRYTLDHMGLSEAVRGRFRFKAYPTGHQIYADAASAVQLKTDVEGFFNCTLAEDTCPLPDLR
jgi:carboxypeptidase C (cathepsin A)